MYGSCINCGGCDERNVEMFMSIPANQSWIFRRYCCRRNETARRNGITGFQRDGIGNHVYFVQKKM